MDIVNKNIRYLRKQKGDTQQQFADKLDIKRSLLGAYEEGRARPNFDVQKKITHMFNITLDQLMTQDLSSMVEKKFFAEGAGKNVSGSNLRVLAVTVDKEDNENIELVPEKAAAGYLNGYADPEFISELPRFRLPFMKGGTFRAFEIKGDSMLPLQPGSIVIGEYVENWQDIKDGHPYIVISNQEGIVYKRVFNHVAEHGKLMLQSDNPSYPAYSIEINDALEIWKARAYISTIFPDNDFSVQNMMKMMMELQDELRQLKGKAS